LPKALNKIYFTIKPLDKVGVVGRTGAGKSTITMTLLRLLEATEGSIKID
jgi:ABC-type multidrug transport system fused ATPase/permease subunit